MELRAIQERFATLVDLFWNGILLDRDEQHTQLWLWTLQQAINARERRPTQSYTDWWEALEHYPAFLLIRAGIMAALAADNERLIRQLLEEPTWTDRLRQDGQLPAYEVLHLHMNALDHEVVATLFPSTRSSSHFVRERLRPIAESIAGSSSAADWLMDRMEYRFALASTLLALAAGPYVQPAAGGEYLRAAWRAPRDRVTEFPVTADFRKGSGPAVWGYRSSEPDAFASAIAQLEDYLWDIAREARSH